MFESSSRPGEGGRGRPPRGRGRLPGRGRGRGRDRPGGRGSGRGRGPGAQLDGGVAPKQDEPPRESYKGMFRKELRVVMYGYGDNPEPLPETVDLVEEVMINYVVDLVHKLMAATSHKPKALVEDLEFLLRKDSKKLARVRELLKMQKELTEARKVLSGDNTLPEMPVEEIE